MRRITVLLAAVVLVGSIRGSEAPAADVKAAVEKGLKRIAEGIANYPKHRQCFSCHHQAMAVLSLTAARKHGFEVDVELLNRQIDFSLRTFRNKTLISGGRGVGGDSTSVGYALTMLGAVDRPYDATTEALLNYLLARQRRDGSWPVPAQRQPTMGSLFTNTALALAALKKFGPPLESLEAADLQERLDAAFARGRDWLLAHPPKDTEDKVFHLRGLVDAGAETKVIEEARDRLLAEQRPDGSWSQLEGREGDAYATGTVLVALRHAGLDASHQGYRQGVEYLLRSQKEDGAWIVQTRSRPLQPFFDNGDPGGKSQFISFVATNWAVLALLETFPQAPGSGPGKGRTGWIFGLSD
jgi:N-acyl-D-amino-acid deacylase